MAAYTGRGWQVDPTPPLTTWAWPGGAGSATTRAGDATTVLQYLAHIYNLKVESIREPLLDDWSYNKRQITGGTSWSEHAAGTALDINATDHPYKTSAEQNFTQTQIRVIEGILSDLEGAVEWLRGWDPMHFQLARDTGGRLARVAAKVRPDLNSLLTHGTLTGDDDVSAEEVWSHPIATNAGTKRAVDVLAGLDNDLRADLAWKGQQIEALNAKVDQLLQAAQDVT